MMIPAHGAPPTLASWRETGKHISYSGHSIFYQEAGSGPALLCVHGFPTASWDWHALWPWLKARFRVLALDLIGFGYSEKPPDYDYSIFDQATLVEALLSQLGIGQVHLFTHDYGDTVAQELLARHHERRRRGDEWLQIKSLCLLNGGLFPETHRSRPVQRLLAGPLGPLVGRLTNQRSFARSFAATFGPHTQPSPSELAELYSLVEANGGRRIAHKLIRYMEERRRNRDRWVGALERTRVPLLLIDGVADPVSGGHMVARYRELIPNPQIVELDQIGHYPQLEAPRAVADAFLRFQHRLDPKITELELPT
jgi:pimeloyl-ACP methyl ester carboxylesterase